MNCSFKKQDKTLYMQYGINYVKIQRHKIKTGRKVIKMSVVSISEWGVVWCYISFCPTFSSMCMLLYIWKGFFSLKCNIFLQQLKRLCKLILSLSTKALFLLTRYWVLHFLCFKMSWREINICPQKDLYASVHKSIIYKDLQTNVHSSIINKDLHGNVQSSIIHNNQEVETTQIFISW